MVNVFYSTFLNVSFIFATFFTLFKNYGIHHQLLAFL